MRQESKTSQNAEQHLNTGARVRFFPYLSRNSFTHTSGVQYCRQRGESLNSPFLVLCGSWFVLLIQIRVLFEHGTMFCRPICRHLLGHFCSLQARTENKTNKQTKNKMSSNLSIYPMPPFHFCIPLFVSKKSNLNKTPCHLCRDVPFPVFTCAQ